MNDIIDITELDGNDDLVFGGSAPSDMEITRGIPSSSLGSGVELLMNQNVRDSSMTRTSVELEDITSIANEMNDLVEDMNGGGGGGGRVRFDDDGGGGHDFAGNGAGFYSAEPSPRHSPFVEMPAEPAPSSTSWFGNAFGKVENMSTNLESSTAAAGPENGGGTPIAKMSKEEALKEKFKCLRKLERFEKKGIQLSKKYSMESSLIEMLAECETIEDDINKQASIKFQGQMLMTFVNGIEFLNGKFNPFDIALDGWCDQVQENITDYDDIFAALHEKYKHHGSIAPELRLLFQLGGSASLIHFSNTMFKSQMPSMDDIFRQHPDLMRSFQAAAVNTMSQTSPGFSNFMTGVMNHGPGGSGSLPPPMATQSMRPAAAMPAPNPPSSSRRPEMKGPGDISSILNGLKTKQIPVETSSAPSHEKPVYNPNPFGSHHGVNPGNSSNNNSSTISYDELRDVNSSKLPKHSSRRKRKDSQSSINLDF